GCSPPSLPTHQKQTPKPRRPRMDLLSHQSFVGLEAVQAWSWYWEQPQVGNGTKPSTDRNGSTEGEQPTGQTFFAFLCGLATLRLLRQRSALRDLIGANPSGTSNPRSMPAPANLQFAFFIFQFAIRPSSAFYTGP